jgi:hypothetical protein
MGIRADSVVRAHRFKLVLAAAILAISPALDSRSIAGAHPLHTSLAQVQVDTRNRTVSVSLRVFADDFGKAAARERLSLPAYAAKTFKIFDDSGTQVPMQACGEKHVGDLVWLCFSAKTPQPKSITLWSGVLFETYSDQINVVQTTVDGRKGSLLFIPGDKAKLLHS